MKRISLLRLTQTEECYVDNRYIILCLQQNIAFVFKEGVHFRSLQGFHVLCFGNMKHEVYARAVSTDAGV